MKKVDKSQPEWKVNVKPAWRQRISIHVTAIIFFVLVSFAGSAQTTVFYDDFNRAAVSPGGIPEMTYTQTNTGAGTSLIESSLTTGTAPYLKITNGNPAGRGFVTGPLASFGAPFNTTLSANSGLVSWTFNIRHSRGGSTVTTLGGFASASYGIAAVLAATDANLLNTGCNGYAVVMGAPSSGNVYNLVKFTNGLTANANFTTLVSGTLPSMTSPNNLRDYMSIKVTYDPITNLWKLYERVDGLSAAAAWADPTTITETNYIGSTTDNSYTGSTMSAFGYLWNYSTSAGINAFFDNFGVAVTPVVTPVLSVTPGALSGFSYISGSGPSAYQTYNVSGVNLDGSNIVITGSTNYEVSTDNITFSGSGNISYSGSTLAATPVYVKLKAGLTAGNYNGENILNAGGNADTAMVSCSGFVLAPPATYTWAGANNGDWQVAANWNPERTSPVINDILVFNNGNADTVLNVPTQTIGQMKISGGSKVTLKAAASAVLTIAGGTGDDLTVTGINSELNIAGSAILAIGLNSGATGLIEGSMTVSGAAHSLKSIDAASLFFAAGSICKATTGFTGNLFGALNLNSVKFQSGSTYIQDAGSNPFGAGQPTSVVNFEPGSLYKFTASSGGPSYSGRTYANFENDSPTTTQNNQGSNPMTCDNYTVTSGIVNWDFSGGLVIKGNIAVAMNATLTFGNATKVTNLTLNGTQAQAISGEGTLTFGSNSTIIVNNAAGIILSRNITSYNLTFQNGIISTGINTLSLTAGAVISGAGSGKFVNGKLQMNIPSGASSTTFSVGDATNYTPVIVDFPDVTTSGNLTVNTTAGLHPNAATSGLNLAKCVNRYWTMANTGIVFSTYDATFTFVAGDVPAGANPDNFIVMKWDPSTWSPTTTGTLTATTTKITGVTSFSDFIDGEAGISIPENLTVTGLVENGQSTCYNATQTITIAGGATTFVIDNGGSATMIAGQNILYYPGTLVNSGGYMLGYIAPSGPYCGGLTPSMMAVKTAVEEPVGNQSTSFFSVYPNPTTGSFTIELTAELPSGDVNVEVYGMQGNKIINTVMNHERKQTLSLEGNQPGCYFIRVLSGQKSGAAKIIKQ